MPNYARRAVRHARSRLALENDVLRARTGRSLAQTRIAEYHFILIRAR